MTFTASSTRGRRRDADLTHRILDETLRSLAEGGYAGLRIGQIADTLGCGKTAIYRRWGSRAELAVAALLSRMGVGERLRSGDVIEELTEHVWQHARNQMAATYGPNVATGILAVTADPEVRDRFHEQFIAIRRQMGREIIAEAVARKQLPEDVDGDAMLDLFAGFVYYRGAIRLVPLVIDDIRELVRSTVAEPPRRIAARAG